MNNNKSDVRNKGDNRIQLLYLDVVLTEGVEHLPI